MTRALLSLGSNLGDRYGHLRAALDRLAADGMLVAESPLYETPPWGDPDQPAYLNAAALVESDRPVGHWLDVAQALERAAGRQRDPARRFGPRTLDVDVIAVWTADGGDVVSDDPELTLPHPRAHLRAFVLRPWLDLMPDAEVPGHGRVADLLSELEGTRDLGREQEDTRDLGREREDTRDLGREREDTRDLGREREDTRDLGREREDDVR